jgi:hypothetical protein
MLQSIENQDTNDLQTGDLLLSTTYMVRLEGQKYARY